MPVWQWFDARRGRNQLLLGTEGLKFSGLKVRLSDALKMFPIFNSAWRSILFSTTADRRKEGKSQRSWTINASGKLQFSTEARQISLPRVRRHPFELWRLSKISWWNRNKFSARSQDIDINYAPDDIFHSPNESISGTMHSHFPIYLEPLKRFAWLKSEH